MKLRVGASPHNANFAHGNEGVLSLIQRSIGFVDYISSAKHLNLKVAYSGKQGKLFRCANFNWHCNACRKARASAANWVYPLTI